LAPRALSYDIEQTSRLSFSFDPSHPSLHLCVAQTRPGAVACEEP